MPFSRSAHEANSQVAPAAMQSAPSIYPTYPAGTVGAVYNGYRRDIDGNRPLIEREATKLSVSGLPVSRREAIQQYALNQELVTVGDAVTLQRDSTALTGVTPQMNASIDTQVRQHLLPQETRQLYGRTIVQDGSLKFYNLTDSDQQLVRSELVANDPDFNPDEPVSRSRYKAFQQDAARKAAIHDDRFALDNASSPDVKTNLYRSYDDKPYKIETIYSKSKLWEVPFIWLGARVLSHSMRYDTRPDKTQAERKKHGFIRAAVLGAAVLIGAGVKIYLTHRGMHAGGMAHNSPSPSGNSSSLHNSMTPSTPNSSPTPTHSPTTPPSTGTTAPTTPPPHHGGGNGTPPNHGGGNKPPVQMPGHRTIAQEELHSKQPWVVDRYYEGYKGHGVVDQQHVFQTMKGDAKAYMHDHPGTLRLRYIDDNPNKFYYEYKLGNHWKSDSTGVMNRIANYRFNKAHTVSALIRNHASMFQLQLMNAPDHIRHAQLMDSQKKAHAITHFANLLTKRATSDDEDDIFSLLAA